MNEVLPHTDKMLKREIVSAISAKVKGLHVTDRSDLENVWSVIIIDLVGCQIRVLGKRKEAGK